MRSMSPPSSAAPSIEPARPLVSVVIPTYNAARYIEETISSVLAQTYPNKEVIVVDDGSADETESVVRGICAADSRVSFHKLERNCGGPAWARNVGVDLATADYLAFLDADDLWHPQKLELQMEAVSAHGVPFVSTGITTFSERQHERVRALQRVVHPFSEAGADRITHRRLLRKNVIANSSVLLDRRAFSRVTFAEDRALIAVEDYECWLRLHQEIPYSVRLELPLLYYRRSPQGISRSKAAMFRKVNHMLRGYSYGGRPLGWSRYLYLSTYVALSAWGRISTALAIRPHG